MTPVASFYNMGEAGLALSVLEGAGIPAQLSNLESSVNLMGGPPAIRLLVAESDSDKAREVLANEAVPPGPKTPSDAS